MAENLHGNVFRFGDDIDTGQIIPGSYVVLTDPEELAKHVFEAIAPDFRSKIKSGDIIVAGKNFGTGSSREHAPKAIKFSGVSAIIAKSFSRIFYRNAINVGLLAIAIPEADRIDDSNELTISLDDGKIVNHTKHEEYEFNRPPQEMLQILEAGGIIPYTRNMIAR